MGLLIMEYELVWVRVGRVERVKYYSTEESNRPERGEMLGVVCKEGDRRKGSEEKHPGSQRKSPTK